MEKKWEKLRKSEKLEKSSLKNVLKINYQNRIPAQSSKKGCELRNYDFLTLFLPFSHAFLTRFGRFSYPFRTLFLRVSYAVSTLFLRLAYAFLTLLLRFSYAFHSLSLAFEVE